MPLNKETETRLDIRKLISDAGFQTLAWKIQNDAAYIFFSNSNI